MKCIRLLVSSVIACFLFASCETNLDLNNISDEIALQPDLVVPLGNGSVSLGKVLSNNLKYPEIRYDDPLEIYYLSCDTVEFPFEPTVVHKAPSVTGSVSNRITTFVYRQPWDYYQYFPEGSLAFSNPKVDITMMSNVGTYLSFSIDYIKSYSNADSTVAPVYAWFNNHTTNSVADQFDSRPQSEGTWVVKHLKTFDKDWGEIKPLFGTTNPFDVVEYQFTVWVNQLLAQNDPQPANLASWQRIKALITTTIPFHLDKGSYFIHRDTISADLGAALDVLDHYPADKITSASVVLNVINRMPCNSTLSLKYLDSLGNALLPDRNEKFKVVSAKVNEDGLVEKDGAERQTILQTFTTTELDELKKAKTIVSSVLIDGKDINSNIHFSRFDTFDLKLGLYIKTDFSRNP